MSDRRFAQRRFRGSGLNLVIVAIARWNATDLDRTTQADENLLQYLSPLGRDHTNFIGDYVWRSSMRLGRGKLA